MVLGKVYGLPSNAYYAAILGAEVGMTLCHKGKFPTIDYRL